MNLNIETKAEELEVPKIEGEETDKAPEEPKIEGEVQPTKGTRRSKWEERQNLLNDVKASKDEASKVKAENEAMKQKNAEIDMALKKAGYGGIDEVLAEQSGQTIEQYRSSKSSEAELQAKLAQAEMAKQSAQSMMFENMMQMDERALKDAFSDFKGMNELPDKYWELRKNFGAVDSVKMLKALEPVAPPSTPSTTGSSSQEQTFFTKEQVEKMSQSEVAKNLDKIQESMTKWK